jgi:hypothetical protein
MSALGLSAEIQHLLLLLLLLLLQQQLLNLRLFSFHKRLVNKCVRIPFLLFVLPIHSHFLPVVRVYIRHLNETYTITWYLGSAALIAKLSKLYS